MPQAFYFYLTHLNKVFGNWQCCLIEQSIIILANPLIRVVAGKAHLLTEFRKSAICLSDCQPRQYDSGQSPNTSFPRTRWRKLSKLIRPTFMWHLPKGRLGGGRARVSHPRAQQGSCRVQRRRRRLPAPHCRSARRVFRSAVTFGDAAATATSARTKVQAQPTAADRATAASAVAAAAAAVSTAATSGHANTMLKSFGMARSDFSRCNLLLIRRFCA